VRTGVSVIVECRLNMAGRISIVYTPRCNIESRPHDCTGGMLECGVQAQNLDRTRSHGIAYVHYGLETGTLHLQRPQLVVVSRGPQGHDVTLHQDVRSTATMSYDLVRFYYVRIRTIIDNCTTKALRPLTIIYSSPRSTLQT